LRIARGALVVLSYQIQGEGGEVLESSAEEGELRYRHGSGELLPALEEALEGHAAGERVRVELDPQDGFGVHDPDGLLSVPRGEIPCEAEILAGDYVPLTIELESGETIELEGRVVSCDEREVVLDTNHPLAGRRITFDVTVVSVESPLA
jgi:FKBP-type peptidyl-prolyl cis-trans isomerase SlyD